MAVKTNRLVIYMLKPECKRIEDALDTRATPIPIDGVGAFAFTQSQPYRPGWVEDFFGRTLDPSLRILSSSAKGVLVVPVGTKKSRTLFAVTFGMGRHLLKEDVVEERFGLKVVLNSVGEGQVRSIDKTTLGSVPKHSREQMSRDVATAEFGIDIEQDLVNAITAKSSDPRFGKTITGRDALSLSVKADITTIGDLLSHCRARYASADYRKDFDWIDQITEVRSSRITEHLNATLIDKLTGRHLEKIWMAVPEVISWSDCKGFRYLRPKRAELVDDLDMEGFLDVLKGERIDADRLRESSVFMISAKDEDIGGKWSALRCICAEIEDSGKVYVLNNGKWYEIARGFSDQVAKDFANVPESKIRLPECSTNEEEVYNKEAASKLSGIHCMDRDVVPHGGGRGKVEFCDLYTTDKKIIHVKRYGASAVLSHLFSQGVVSGELFVGEADFRRKVNKKLPVRYRLDDPGEQPNAREYEVVYAIISNSTAPLDIPFFSKVSLRNARRRLMNYGYKVTLKKILKVDDGTAPKH